MSMWRRLGGFGLLAAGVLLFCLLGLRVLPTHRGLAGAAVASIDKLPALGAGGWASTLLALVFLAALCWRYPRLGRPRSVAQALVFLFLCLLSVFLSRQGHYGLILGFSVLASVGLGGLAPLLKAPKLSELKLSVGLWVFLAVLHSVYSVHRHYMFGSGSWDMGIYINDIYLAAHGMTMNSSILGEVDILGSHFMPGLYLYAPLAFIPSSYSLLIVQAMQLASIGPAIYWIARHRGVGRGASLVLGLAAGLSFSVQSAAFFDVHEIAFSFGFFALGLWAFEVGRMRLASASFFVFILFKESLAAYIVALGLLAIWRGIYSRRRAQLAYGGAWVIFGAAYFLIVNLALMPYFAARGNPLKAVHFNDFGPNLSAAAVAMVQNPAKTLGAFFTPGEKLASWMATLGGVGWLSFFSPQIAIAALPLAAERFLVSKRPMWGMGYHYGVPLSFYAFWATARGWRQARLFTRAMLGKLGGPALGARAGAVLIVYLFMSSLLVDAFGYRSSSEYLRWGRDYFSTPARAAAHRVVIERLRGRGSEARIAAQNHLIPHLSRRQYIFMIDRWQKADWVLLSLGESAWPFQKDRPKRLARRLYADPEWRLVDSRLGTVLFMRAGAADWPAVAPSGRLRQALR